MTPKELEEALQRLGLTIPMAADLLGIHRSHLWKILKGQYEVPGPVAGCVECWLVRQEENFNAAD